MASSIFGSNFGNSTWDGTTLSVTGIINAATALSVGTTPAQSGAVRLGNNAFVTGRNTTNTGDGNLLALDSSNFVNIAPSIANILLGSGTSPQLGFGSLTSAAFVTLKRNGATLMVRVGDDTAYALLDTLGLKSSGATTSTFGPSAVASLTTVSGMVTAAS